MYFKQDGASAGNRRDVIIFGAYTGKYLLNIWVGQKGPIR